MTIIPLEFSIHRNHATGKKYYIHKHTKKQLKGPLLPRNWQNSTDYKDVKPQQAPSHAIRCDDDLIVIDCDDLETTEFMNDKLVPTPASEPDHYIVQSDKGERHFYFRPTEYYNNSALYKDSRQSVGKIDVLHGRALVYAVCPDNTTKNVIQGSLSELTDIPDNIVDALADKLRITITAPDSDYKPIASYLAPKIEQALALYSRKQDYATYLQPLMQLITPSKFRYMVEPSYHPDNVEEKSGTDYIQSLTAKLGQDPSISLELTTEVLTLITQKLWSDPWDDDRLKKHIKSIPGQTYHATKKPVFVYSDKATDQPLVSVNGNEYMPIYRTLDDEYIVAKPTGSVEVIKGLSNFKKAMASKNYEILINGAKVNLDNNIGMKKLSEILKTVRIRNEPYYNTGEYEDDGSLYYNIYRPTKYLGIIRGDYKQDDEYQGASTHPTITKIIKNLMYDHDDIMYEKFIKFLAHKLKTLDYSPIVFQMMGGRGVGKSLFMEILNYLTEGVVEVSFSKSNAQFNEEQENAIFLNEDEGLVTGKLINNIKKMSGKPRVLIEGKGKTPYTIRNVGTYICTTNKTTPMAETMDDRRFVTLSSFKAKELNIPDIKIKIAMELEAFALCLRETKLDNHRLYTTATEWHDDIHRANFTEKQENVQDLPGKLASVMYNVNSTDGTELHREFVGIFGDGYHYVLSKKATSTIAIPLNKHPKLVRQSDQSQLTHEITREQLKAVGLDSYIKQDKNGANSRYGTNFYKLEVLLSPTQMEEWQAAYEGYSEVEGEDIDISD